MSSPPGPTRSPWMEDAPAAGSPLSVPIQTDVCIIGGGIAGLTAGYLLAREGRRIVVLEQRVPGAGETGRTTAHLSNALDDRYFELEKLHGRDGAHRAADSHTAAIDCIQEIVERERIACGFTRLDGYLARHPDDEADILERELEASHRAGLRDVELLSDSPVSTFSRGKVLRFPRQAQFHPLQYLRGLGAFITSSGGAIYTGSHVVNVEDGDTPRATLAGGHTVTARSIIVATNSPISDLVAIHTKQAPYRTYAISLRLEPGAVPLALYWDTGDPYHYVRTYTHDDGHDSLIVGGEDHKTGQASDTTERFTRLEAWTREHFSMAGAVEHAWSGQVMEPVDHLAFIGRDVGARNVYIATGDSGHGMTHGTIAGLLLRDLIVARSNRWESLYAPDRKSLKAAGTYTRENLNVARQFGDYVKPGEVKHTEEIGADSGALLRQGTHLLAVYRDPAGQLHSCSAVCTHIACVVHWNPTEKSWDCPCHGSRFTPQGAVISGPAVSPLAAVALAGD